MKTIPLSLVAREFGDGSLPKFAAFETVGHYVREQGIYPRDGRMQKKDGVEFSSLLRLQTLQQIENRINDLVDELRETRDRHEAALGQALEIANTATDPYELHYMGNMFMYQREVLRAVAKNPNLSEKTQLLIVSMELLRDDREIQLGLAHNPSLCPVVMEKMMSYTEDVFVLQGIAHNAARQSQINREDTAFAAVCKELALVHWDTTLSKAAIPGVKDPDVLRRIAENNSALYAADKLELVAQNPHTPDDVLTRMAETPLARMQHAVGIDYAIKARHTLATKRQCETAAVSVPDAGLVP